MNESKHACFLIIQLFPLEQYLTEQMELLQHEENMNQRFFEEQVENFDNSVYCMEDDNNNSNNDNTVPCPICHTGLLIMDTTSRMAMANHGIIYCQNRSHPYQDNINITSPCCKLSRGACFGEKMTLPHFKETLIRAYEEHSKFCWGVLQFDLSESQSPGCHGLLVLCKQCSLQNLLIPALPPVSDFYHEEP
jgi:hypothetical protein